MRIHEKDYRYLLLHVVPTHRLPPPLRRQVDHALVAGSPSELRRQSVRALEALCEDNTFTRVGVRPEDGHVVVEYKKRHGRFRLSLAVPREEWQSSDITPESAPKLPPAVEEPPAPPRAAREDAPATVTSPDPPQPLEPQEPAPDPFAFVTDLVRSFAVADRSEPVVARLESLLETLQRIVDIADIQLFVRDDVLDEEDSRGERVRIVADAELRSTDVLRDVIESGAQRLYRRDALDDGRWAGDGTWAVLGAAPIFSMGKVHGVLCALFADGLDADTMNARLRLATDTVRRIIEYHNQIGNMTSFDALTGVYNRHFFDDQLPVEIERAMRSGSVVSMLVIDIDNFKKVNDDLGHKKGDEALAAVAELIRRNLRKVDLPFRYGGEEFVILLPGTSEFESVHTGERLRRVIAQYEGFLDGRGRPRQLTVCVGVSVFPDTAKTPDELFTQADRAMYRAKQAGKNRVILYRPEADEGDM